MKHVFSCFFALALLLVIFPPYSFSASPSVFIGRIDGQVYDEQRNPVADAFVELANEVGSMIGHTKTSSNGRFSFFGVSGGTFAITVKPFGKNLLEQTQSVYVPLSVRGNSESAYVDFYLRSDKAAEQRASMPPEAVFAQEIPAEAKKAFQSGSKDLDDGDNGGLLKLEEAIKIFPTYFDALRRLGSEYVARAQYEKGYPYLLRAIDVNGQSFSAFYGLGYAFYQLKKYPAALKAAEACILINGGNSDAQLLFGTLQRISGNYKGAEISLLKAKSLSKKVNPEIYLQLALLYNRLNRNGEAADNLDQYLRLVPDSPDKKKIRANIEALRAKG
jgi:tetratricopeptide (TPR) repeat protein